MTTALAIVATLSLLGILHGYFGYPLLMMALAKVRGARRASSASSDFEPSVSLLVCAYNEERAIADKVRNSLALDWPAAKFEVVVVSDGSKDRTCEIVRSFDDPRVRLVALEKNAGKTNAVHAGMAECRGEIVVLSDANSMYDADAVRHLVAALADERVGAACGELKYDAGDSASGETEGLYWRYETAIKRAESDASTLLGANGSIYAIRRAEFVPIATDLMDDFLIPLMIAVEHRKPTIYFPAAVAREEPGDDFAKEYRRKIRIVSSALLSLVRTAPKWLRRPGIAFQLLSHKALRWFAPYLAILLFASTLALAALRGPLAVSATVFVAAQVAFYAAMAWVALMPRLAERVRPLRVLYYFYVVNSAAFFGILHFLSGKKYVTWKTIRS